MTILELCLSPALGGLELYMFRTAEVLAKTDDVLAVISADGPLKGRFSAAQRPFIAAETRIRPFPIMTARRLAAVIDARDIDIIHMHWGKDLPLAALSKSLSKRKPKLVYTRHMKMTRRKEDPYHRFLYRRMDLMLAVTDNLAREAAHFLGEEHAGKIRRLYCGVEPPTPLPEDRRTALRSLVGISPDEFLVGLFGRISEAKGQHLLIDAVLRADRNQEKLSALIVGRAMDPDYLEKIKKTAADSTLSGRIAFKGFIDDPQAWMQACDCIVLTSREETFGLVLIEAMAAGVPVIGSDRGGVPEIIDHEATGLLFPSGKSEILSRQLIRLKNDPKLRIRFALAGREKARRCFSSVHHYRLLRRHMSAL